MSVPIDPHAGQTPPAAIADAPPTFDSPQAMSMLDAILDAQPSVRVADAVERLQDAGIPASTRRNRADRYRQQLIRMGLDPDAVIRPATLQNGSNAVEWEISREGRSYVATSPDGRRLRLVLCGTCFQSSCRYSQWVEE